MNEGGGAWSDDWYENRQYSQKGYARVPHYNEDGTKGEAEVADERIPVYRDKYNKHINMNRQERGDSASRRRLRKTGRKIKDALADVYDNHKKVMGAGLIATGLGLGEFVRQHWPRRAHVAKPVKPFHRIP